MVVIPPMRGCHDGDADGEDRPLGPGQVSSPAPGLLEGAQTVLLAQALVFCCERAVRYGRGRPAPRAPVRPPSTG